MPVRGNSFNILISLICLNDSTLELKYAISDCSSTLKPCLIITNTFGVSSYLSSLIPITAASSTALWLRSTDSSSAGDTTRPLNSI